MKVGKSAETYQVGAHFKALTKAILVAQLKSFESFFRISHAGLCLKSNKMNQLYFVGLPVAPLQPQHGASPGGDFRKFGGGGGAQRVAVLPQVRQDVCGRGAGRREAGWTPDPDPGRTIPPQTPVNVVDCQVRKHY